MKKFIQEKILPPVMKFLNTKAISAIKNGMLYPIPFIIIGSIFLILSNFPYTPIANWFVTIGWTPFFNQAYNASFGIFAIFAVFGIAYSWVKEEGFEAVPAGMTAIIVDILLQPNFIANPFATALTGGLTQGKTTMTAAQVTSAAHKLPEAMQQYLSANVTGAINTTWLGGKGMILAILVGLLVGWSYTWFMKKKITIKMPEQVPSNVAASFTALIPSLVITFVAMLIFGVSEGLTKQTPVDWVYTLIQTPLQHVSDGPLGVFIIAFLPVFIWWFGVHGATIIGGIMSPLLLANNSDNLYLYQHHVLKMGETLAGHSAHIVTQAFMDQFLTVTGSGMTIGFVIFMLLRAKSVQMKTIGRMEIGPALFNINEPVLFGMPIVLNPMLAIPFFAAPLLSGYLTYLVIWLHIIPPFNGEYVPWTTPPVISGFLVGGWQGALWQLLMLVMTVFIYWPFAARYDRILLKEEKDAYEAEHGKSTESAIEA